MAEHILIIEDDMETAQSIIHLLSGANYKVDHARNKQDALKMLKDGRYDVATMDIMLGHEKNAGINLISYINQERIDIPILVISGMDPTVYADITLNMIGVWDFIAKPFDSATLMTKLVRMLDFVRKQPKRTESVLSSMELTLNVSYPGRSTWKKHRLPLSLTQFRILSLLVEHAGLPVSYLDFYKVIDSGHNPTNVRSHIRKIRDLFKGADSDFSIIQSVPGIGYIWVDG